MTHAILLTWNIERRAPGSWQAAMLMERIAHEAPDIVCATEAWAGSTAGLGGYELAVRGPTWAWDRRPGERLVVLWSAAPWREIAIGDERAGGVIRAVTQTPAGPLQVIGLCAPSHAVSPVDAREKAKLWTEQMRFWSDLGAIMAARLPGLPTVALGDFNQYLPRIWGAKTAHDACLAAMQGLAFATAGQVKDARKAAIDHIVHTPDLAVSDVRALDHFAPDGRRLSDHFGLVATARRA